MLQQTARRLSGQQYGPAIIVSGEEQRFFIKRQMAAAGADVGVILLEPEGRNTSAAAGLAAEWLCSTGGDDLLLIMPSDHVIGNEDAFHAAVQKGIPHAEAGAIVTFGVKVTEPNTQYGYIEVASVEKPEDGVYPIGSFTEKPDAEAAAQHMSSGRYFWNLGIFLVKASTLLDEMREFLPHSLDAISRSFAGAASDGIFLRPEREAFLGADNISIDHGVMEKTRRAMVVPVEMDWSDVGAWDAVWKVSEKDSQENVTQGDVVAIDTKNSLLRTDGHSLIATVGLDNLVVIATRDAVLVAPLDRAADVGRLVQELQAQGRDCVALPSKVARPWGSYETVDAGARFQIKHIIVDPGEILSLQMHFHRSEHWVVVRGTAEVTIGEDVFLLQENQSTYIPAGTKHRLANPGKVPLELVEVQCGPYLGEDDIRRLDDEYGRT
jgi:mannose-1-phosphate guanylyltransferase/mannose-6-phosphate isomerase